PVALVREFLGGLFGADGWAPTLHRQGSRDDAAVLTAPAYSQVAKPENVRELRGLMASLVRLLARCGVETNGYRVDAYPTRRSAPPPPPPAIAGGGGGGGARGCSLGPAGGASVGGGGGLPVRGGKGAGGAGGGLLRARGAARPRPGGGEGGGDRPPPRAARRR